MIAQATRSYLVIWEIDIVATSPEDAARQALAIQRDPISTATIFEIDGKQYDAGPTEAEADVCEP